MQNILCSFHSQCSKFPYIRWCVLCISSNITIYLNKKIAFAAQFWQH